MAGQLLLYHIQKGRVVRLAGDVVCLHSIEPQRSNTPAPGKAGPLHTCDHTIKQAVYTLWMVGFSVGIVGACAGRVGVAGEMPLALRLSFLRCNAPWIQFKPDAQAEAVDDDVGQFLGIDGDGHG